MEKCNEESVYKENTIGVHVRRTDHFLPGEFLDMEFFYRLIDSKLKDNNYQNILLITDEHQVVEEFVSNYGDMILLNKNIYRSEDKNAIHYKYLENLDSLAQEIMIESISLSRCEEIIITASNISGYSMMLNPQMKFEQIDIHINHR